MNSKSDFSKIKDPDTGEIVETKSKKGKEILKKYIMNFLVLN